MRLVARASQIMNAITIAPAIEIKEPIEEIAFHSV